MDVCIPGDDTVSRERHGVVIFDPKKQVFWVLPGDASGLVYLNGEIVHSPTQLKHDDVLELGQTKLVLIPFCGDKYRWEEESAPPAKA
jgi:pSer/pThr/pTyr-binding forkhead associated (FHA) protein